MKKFTSALLALTMILSVFGMVAFAAGTTVTLGLAANPTIDGAVSDAANIKVDDVFEVAVKLSDLQGTAFTSGQIVLTWDPAKVEVVDTTGKKATAKSKAFSANETVLPSEDEDEEPIFDWKSLVTYNADAGKLDLTTTLSTSSEYAKIGYPLNGLTEFEFFTVRFKALAAGDAGIAVEKSIIYLGTSESPVTVTPVSFTIKEGGEDPKPEVVTKTIESVDVSSITTALQAPVSYTIPTTLKGKIAGSDETVDVTVAWTPAVVTESVKATGVVTAPADTETVKYVLADAAKTLTVDFTVEAEEKPPVDPEKPVVGSIEKPAVPTTAKVGDTVELPKFVKAIADGKEVELPIVWEPATVDTTTAGEKTVVGTVNTEEYDIADDVPTTFTVTITVEAVEEPPVEEPDVEIVSVVAPEITVYVGTESDDVKAQLGETVVGLTADGEEVAVNVAWTGTVDTKKAATKSVKGTLTAPEGYVLAKKLTTVTATVHVVKVPVDTTIDSVDDIAPITVFVGDKVALPATVVGYVTETKTVDVTVEWPEVDTSAAGVQEIVGKLVAPKGYDLAEGLTEVKAIVTVIAIADLPVELGEITVNGDGQINIPVTVKANAGDYAVGNGKLDDYDTLVVVATFMNGITPVSVYYNASIKKDASVSWTSINVPDMVIGVDVPADADTIQYCVVVGYDYNAPVSIDNLGIPVGAARPYVIGE